jgi:hypothetical protein
MAAAFPKLQPQQPPPPSEPDAAPSSISACEQSRSAVSKFLKGKEEEWKAVSERKGPLTLLELPVDILRLIVKEVRLATRSILFPTDALSSQITHTNDLTALALTNSTLHNLAVPHIYARFDIVWPDGHITASDSKSVDALTYGLSTLCLGSSFARTTRRLFQPGTPIPRPRFRGNEYAKYTRKFSLGNGPADWVAEYMITKESGKMLGTLVALALAKMTNLETFVWDMPTGVLADIFMALASLPEHYETNECKLDRVWIRWHDNNEGTSSSSSLTNSLAQPVAVVPAGSTLTPIGILLPANAVHPPPRAPVPFSEHAVEYPTFSVLPPLKSLSVLEIDELSYLDEMADLIERSKDRLQELRVGISSKATHKDFVQAWDGAGLRQIDHDARWPGESSIGERRLGGVLGVLVGKIYDIRRKGSTRGKEKPSSELPVVTEAATSSVFAQEQTAAADDSADGSVATNPVVANVADGIAATVAAAPIGAGTRCSKWRGSWDGGSLHGHGGGGKRKLLEGKLKLQTLELERIPLSMQVCRQAFDWTVLANLTILECAQHENLWKLLRRQFQPTPVSAGFGISSSKTTSTTPLQYHLSLKRIHTDATSPALITFIKETLAPNSLEILFLQDRRRGSGPPPVTIEQIFKGALRRHRGSLRKLLLDSSAKGNVQPSGTIENIRWRNWVLSTEALLYITSGRMANLRELSVSLDYKDWVSVLLPYIKHFYYDANMCLCFSIPSSSDCPTYHS